MSKFSAAESAAFHHNTSLDGRTLAPTEREHFLKKYLPTTPNGPMQEPRKQTRQSRPRKVQKSQRKKPIRTFAGSQLHLFLCKCR